MKPFLHNRFLRTLFFGNYFYGLSAVLLSIEAVLQQGSEMPGNLFFILCFISTVLFYSKAYLVTEEGAKQHNLRSAWYAANNKSIRVSLLFLIFLLFFLSFYFFVAHLQAFFRLHPLEYFNILIFPLISLLYYGYNFGGKHYRLRRIGWLKPFIIAFSWAGLVTIYPLQYEALEQGSHYFLSFTALYFFVKNFMFIAILCILFDVKDYAMDYNEALKTFVVKLGLRRTLFYLIIPLCLVGFGFFLLFAEASGFSYMKIFLNSIPFVAIILVTYSMSNRHSIFYYLVVIDGLMVLKALCGICARLFF